MPFPEQLIRLAVAALLSGVIGWEREKGQRPAGLRTHLLVGLGSALLMLVSIDVFLQFQGTGQVDPARIAAQVVSGIGFLGAGTILREGPTVRGLTTAASLWVCAAIGLAAGAGSYPTAVVTTVIALAALVLLGRVERSGHGKKSVNECRFRIRTRDRPGQLGRVGTLLGEHGANIKHLEIRATDSEEDEVELELELEIPPQTEPVRLAGDLKRLPEVLQVELERTPGPLT